MSKILRYAPSFSHQTKFSYENIKSRRSSNYTQRWWKLFTFNKLFTLLRQPVDHVQSKNAADITFYMHVFLATIDACLLFLFE